MIALGISAFFHDSAASFVGSDKILFAAQEERYSRIKHDASFPINSIVRGLSFLKINPKQITHISFYEDPSKKTERSFMNFAYCNYRDFEFFYDFFSGSHNRQNVIDTVWHYLGPLGFDRTLIDEMKFQDHHLSHAASAFYPSGFKDAAIVTIDGVGELESTKVFRGSKDSIQPLYGINYPHSLGLLYSSLTQFLGFKVNSGEYKVMGLAPYGRPKFVDSFKRDVIDIKEDGSFWMNMDYFSYMRGKEMTSCQFEALLGVSSRAPEAKLEQIHMDIAASLQAVTEEAIVNIVRFAAEKTQLKKLCMAGGVALNCVANGVVARANFFDDIWIQPAAGDAGGALGAAIQSLVDAGGTSWGKSNKEKMSGALLGESFRLDEIKAALENGNYSYHEEKPVNVNKIVIEALLGGKVVGWFHGRSEFGPRALGNRSIIADAGNAEMQKRLNIKIKFRESFRPFAPIVTDTAVDDLFDVPLKNPYMLIVGHVAEKHRTREGKFSNFLDRISAVRSSIPAVTHVDYSARIQVLDKNMNKKLHQLLNQFAEKSGYPVLVNTSFNVRGEPIVNSPHDALRCFMGTDMDMLVIENFILNKTEQKYNQTSNYHENYELD